MVKKQIPPYIKISERVTSALKQKRPIVALESTVITHGLPYPENLKIALEMEHEIRQIGAEPTTIAILDGTVIVGAEEGQLDRLSSGDSMRKISGRDIASAVAKKLSGGTTVAGTAVIAHLAGIKVFATGGIGGVHRSGVKHDHGDKFDISADLYQLATTPIIVVCAGAKSILDLPATLEFLETWSVPVVGYTTDEFPAFFTRSSGLTLNSRADSPEEVEVIARAHWEIGMGSAVLVANPITHSHSLDGEMLNQAIEQAIQDSETEGIRGQRVTPFLLKRVSEITHGASVIANLELLKNNARLAAKIALVL